MTDRRSFLRALVLVLGAFIALSLLLFSVSVAGATTKVIICHAAGLADEPANYVTLTLPEQAVYGQAGHFNEDGTTQAGHEADYLGACIGEPEQSIGEPSETTIATPTPTPVPSASASGTPEPSTRSPASPSASGDPSVAPSTPADPVPDTAVSGPGDVVLPILGLGIFLILGLTLLVVRERRA